MISIAGQEDFRPVFVAFGVEYYSLISATVLLSLLVTKNSGILLNRKMYQLKLWSFLII
jgi:hypothetical protein